MINDEFACFAEHYSVTVVPARVYKPRDKSLVEGAVKLIYRSIYSRLDGRVFYDLEALNAAIRPALEIHNNKPFASRNYSRREQFEEIEREALGPLNPLRYQINKQVMATVMKNGYVRLGEDIHYYSVPYTHALLIASEYDDRKNRSIERAIRLACFRYKASLEQLDYTIERGLEKNQVHRLAGLDFIKEHKDLFITGSTGTGKSYLATALGYQACQSGYRVMYVNTAKLMGQLKLAKAKGTILAELKRIERIDLLILDDFGLQPFDPQSSLALLDIIEDRHQKRSIIVTSQIPVKEWYDVIGEKTVADAVLDRIVHHSLRVELYGYDNNMYM